MPSVLFVCTANICRSPMAVALFRRYLQQIGRDTEWHVASAGTWARSGDVAHPKVQEVIREYGVDISTHRSRRVNREILAAFDLVLVMERGHREALRVEFADLARRFMCLSEIAGQRFDVSDPVAGSLSDVRNVACEIETLIRDGFERIASLTQTATTQTTMLQAVLGDDAVTQQDPRLVDERTLNCHDVPIASV